MTNAVEFFIGIAVQPFSDELVVQQGFSARSVSTVIGETQSDEIFQFFRVKGRYSVIVTSNDSFLESVDIRSHEGRSESSHFVQYAAHGPDIALAVVGQIRPYLRTSVVWSASLSASKPTFADFTDIKVSQFQFFIIFGQKNVGTLDVSVENVHPVEGLQPVQHLDRHPPDLALGDVLLPLLVALDEPAEIPSRGELGDEQKRPRGLVVDGVLIADDVGVADRGQDSNFVEGVLDLFGVAARDLDLLHGVYLPILFALDLVDRGEGAFSDLGNRLEIHHFRYLRNYIIRIISNSQINTKNITVTQRPPASPPSTPPTCSEATTSFGSPHRLP